MKVCVSISKANNVGMTHQPDIHNVGVSVDGTTLNPSTGKLPGLTIDPYTSEEHFACIC